MFKYLFNITLPAPPIYLFDFDSLMGLQGRCWFSVFLFARSFSAGGQIFDKYFVGGQFLTSFDELVLVVEEAIKFFAGTWVVRDYIHRWPSGLQCLFFFRWRGFAVGGSFLCFLYGSFYGSYEF